MSSKTTTTSPPAAASPESFTRSYNADSSHRSLTPPPRTAVPSRETPAPQPPVYRNETSSSDRDHLYAKVVETAAVVAPAVLPAKASAAGSPDTELSARRGATSTATDHPADGDLLGGGGVQVRYPGFSTTSGFGRGLDEGGERALPTRSNATGQLKFVNTRHDRGMVPSTQKDSAIDRSEPLKNGTLTVFHKDQRVAGDANGERSLSVMSDGPRLPQKLPAHVNDDHNHARSANDRLVPQTGGPIQTTPGKLSRISAGGHKKGSQVPASTSSPHRSATPEDSRARDSPEASSRQSRARSLRGDNIGPSLSGTGGTGSRLKKERAVGTGPVAREALCDASSESGLSGTHTLNDSHPSSRRRIGESFGEGFPGKNSLEVSLSKEIRSDDGQVAARRVSNGLSRGGGTVDCSPGKSSPEVVLSTETRSDDGQSATKPVLNGLSRDGRSAADGRSVADGCSVDGRYLRSPRRNRLKRVEMHSAQRGRSMIDNKAPASEGRRGLSDGVNGALATAVVAPETLTDATTSVVENGPGGNTTSATKTSQRPLNFVSRTAEYAENDCLSDDVSIVEI